MAGAGALQGTQSQAIQQLIQQHDGNVDAARDAYIEAHPDADPTEVRSLFAGLTASTASNVGGGSVVGRPVPMSSTSSMGGRESLVERRV